MKRMISGAVLFLLVYAVATSQTSLLNGTTNGLFRNVNDFVIKPNVMFNTVETKQVIVGGGFDNLGFESNATGGGLIGYYHPGKLPWSVAATLDMKSAKHRVSETTVSGTTTIETTYKNPAFDTYNGGVRFTIGVPDVLNLSAGLAAHFEGTSKNGEEITSTDNTGKETVVITGQDKEFHMFLGIPVGLEFTSKIYNFVEPLILFSQKTTIVGGDTATVPEAGAKKEESEIAYLVYDKLTIQDLFPAPFASETSFWLGIGNAKLDVIGNLEKPAYTVKQTKKQQNEEGVGYEVKFSTQFGMSYLMDFSVGEVELKIKPMAYFDLLLGVHKSVTFGATVAAAAGVYVPLSDLPVALFFGVTPGFQFYNTSLFEESGTTTITTTEKAQRALTTNVFWNGKVGASIQLPKNMALDVTLNVNPSGKTLGLSAMMSVAL